MTAPVFRFGPFCLDIPERRLTHQDRPLRLRGKVFDTLQVLVENHGRLVRKDELMKAVWPDSVVEENSLDHNVSVIRKALGQRASECVYIETVPRQGYRFVAPVRASGAARAPAPLADNPMASGLVEREEPLRALRDALEQADSGARQTVFVTGEPGIGKTTLIRAFVEGVAEAGAAMVARGQCINQRGGGEPYMPVLEALGRLSREDGGACAAALERYAPTWLAQMPSAWRDPGRAARRAPSFGVTSERMLREMADAIEVLTSSRTLVLVLEDLHWADYSTVDLLARLAQGAEPSRLLMVGAYRPSDARARSHPLDAAARQLKLRGCCREIPLGYLTADGVAKYLRARFGGAVPAAATSLLYERTQGYPLFAATVTNAWVADGSLRKTGSRWSLCVDPSRLSFGVPQGLQELVEQQVIELNDGDREIVEAASVGGSDFCPAAIAAALERPDAEIEERCAALARQGRLFTPAGVHEWPDGEVRGSYAFLHSVYREVIYDSLPAGRKVCFHQRIGDRLERGYAGREDDVAAELAAHFREARDAPRAMRYLQRAAEHALARCAHHEAIGRLKDALDMLRRLPDLAERARRELDLLSLLAPALVVTRGFADPEAERAFRRAYELSTQRGAAARFAVVFGLAVMMEARGQFQDAQRLMERHVTEQELRGEFPLEARDLLACSRFHQGAFADALNHGEHGARAYSPDRHSTVSAALGEDPGVDCHAWAALSLWFLGHPDSALAKARLAVSLAGDPSRLYSLAYARTQLAFLHQLRQEDGPALEWADEAIALAGRQGFPYRRAAAQLLRGWALARAGSPGEGIREIQAGINGCAAVGAELDRPYHLTLLAEAQLLADHPAEAAAALEEALDRMVPPAFYYAAEIFRLRGVAALESRHGAPAARQWFTRALDVARAQGSLSLELRAATSMAELGEDQDRERLTQAYGRFTEGFDTPDLRRAAAFLKMAGGRVAASTFRGC